MGPRIERVTEPVHLGEAPHWDVASQSLFFVDIIGMTVHRYTPATGQCSTAKVGLQQVSFIVPIEYDNHPHTDHFVISLGKELVRIFWNPDSDDIKIIGLMAEVETDEDEYRYNRFNDAKCDPLGRLWAGTFNIVAETPMMYPPKGALYTIDADRKVRTHLQHLRMSNGIAFDQKRAKMYFIESSKGVVEQYDFDLQAGTICNPETIFTLKKHEISGLADGMTIDTNGNLWVAIFNAGKIIQIDPRSPETLISTIEMPVKQITSVTFGGKDLDELYVTTGAYKLGEEDLKSSENGAVFRITNVGTKGVPATNFRLRNH